MNWSISADGSFTLQAGDLVLDHCYPAIDGESIHPVRVEIAGKRIRYHLADGAALALSLTADGWSAALETELSGWAKLPWRIAPMAGRVRGATQLFGLGLGFSGPSGWVDLSPADQLFSYESYLTTAFSSAASTVAIGALQHSDFVQKTIISNHQTRRGLTNRHVESADVRAEVAIFTEGIPSPATVKLPTISFCESGDAFDALHALAARIAAVMKCRTSQDACYHWCSWYEKGCNFSMADLEELLAGLRSMPTPPALQSIQIDDGYCPSPGDWLTPSRLWPGGLPAAFSAIEKAGYRPGVWVAPFMVGSLSQLYREHPDWVIRDTSGRPVIEWKKYDASGIPSHIDPEHYALDASHPGVQEYIRQVFRTLRQWGARMYKTDFMDWGLRDTQQVVRYTPNETSVQSFRKILQIIREEIGEESYWLACISPYAPFLGYADGMRIANDVGPAWGDGSQGNMIGESIATQFFNNVFWQNDPDAILLRDYHNDLSDLEVRSLAMFQGFLGSSVNFSDMPHKLPPERLPLMHALRPPAKVSPALPLKWRSDSPVKMLIRGYGNGAKGLLLMNSSRAQQLEAIEVKELFGAEKANVFEWDPGSSSKSLGELTTIVTRLQPHEAKLLYVTQTRSGPPKNGITSPT